MNKAPWPLFWDSTFYARLAGELELESETVERIFAELRLELAEATLPKKAAHDGELTPIHHHGERSYSLDNQPPVIVSAEEHSILGAFAGAKKALSTRALENCVANVSRVMRQLATKFPGAVRMPKTKGDGYYVRVEPAPKT